MNDFERAVLAEVRHYRPDVTRVQVRFAYKIAAILTVLHVEGRTSEHSVFSDTPHYRAWRIAQSLVEALEDREKSLVCRLAETLG